MVGLFNTPHMNTRQKTHIESFFLVTMNHAGRPVRTHAHTRIHQTHACNYEMHMQAFRKKHTTLSFRDATTHTDTHAHTFSKIIKCTRKPVEHTHTHILPFLRCYNAQEGLFEQTHTYTHTHTPHTQHTYAHTYAQMQRALCS